MDLAPLIASIISGVATILMVIILIKQYSLQRMMYLERIANYLVPYLVLLQGLVSTRWKYPSVITTIMLNPDCKEVTGTYGIYLMYLKQTLGTDAKKTLEEIFNMINDYASRRQPLPSNIRSEIIRKVNDMINRLAERYAVDPDSLYPKQCYQRYCHERKVVF